MLRLALLSALVGQALASNDTTVAPVVPSTAAPVVPSTAAAVVAANPSTAAAVVQSTQTEAPAAAGNSTAAATSTVVAIKASVSFTTEPDLAGQIALGASPASVLAAFVGVDDTAKTKNMNIAKVGCGATLGLTAAVSKTHVLITSIVASRRALAATLRSLSTGTALTFGFTYNAPTAAAATAAETSYTTNTGTAAAFATLIKTALGNEATAQGVTMNATAVVQGAAPTRTVAAATTSSAMTVGLTSVVAFVAASLMF